MRFPDWFSNSPKVVLHPGSASSHRNFGVDRFVEVFRFLRDLNPAIAITGSRSEKPLADELSEALADNFLVFNLAGELTLSEAFELIDSADLLLSSDTGIMHLGACTNTRLLSLFWGTAYPWETGAWGPGHLAFWPDIPDAPCNDFASCADQGRCRNEIREEHVALVMQSVLRNESGFPDVPHLYQSLPSPTGGFSWEKAAKSTLLPRQPVRNRKQLDEWKALARMCGDEEIGKQLPARYPLIGDRVEKVLTNLPQADAITFLQEFQPLVERLLQGTDPKLAEDLQDFFGRLTEFTAS